jgi:hypothetical protein
VFLLIAEDTNIHYPLRFEITFQVNGVLSSARMFNFPFELWRIAESIRLNLGNNIFEQPLFKMRA